MELTCFIGARPNFVKAAPLVHELVGRGHLVRIVHTGQHAGAMSDSFINALFGSYTLKHLDLRPGDYRHMRMGDMVKLCGEELYDNPVDACIVVGDVDSTLGAALAAEMTGTPLIHLEAGLRSYDWTMPEEKNRYIVDHLSDLLLASTAAGMLALMEEVTHGTAYFVGNCMIDTLLQRLPSINGKMLETLGLEPQGYVLATFHRPALVDNSTMFSELLDVLGELSLPVLFPTHPRRTVNTRSANLHTMEPLSYDDFIALERDAAYVITDSGGVQEETSVLGVPCLTYRNSTERKCTLSEGTNVLTGVDPQQLLELAASAETLRRKTDIPLWDGNAAPRAATAIEDWWSTRVGS